MQTSTTIDPDEIAKFEAMAADWWDERGKFRPLHKLNPCRLDFINGHIAAHFGRSQRDTRPFEGLRVLDIGCGGGLLCEPLTRLGAEVTGIDAAARNIPVAEIHAAQSGLDITYRHAAAEDLVAEESRFDIVLAMEIVEHVSDPPAFVAACGALTRPGGLMIMSTLNRNSKSFAMAIVGAEYVMRWLPRGTHDWRKFIRPDELATMIHDGGLTEIDRQGMVLNLLTRMWGLSRRDLSVNYVMAATRPEN